MTAWKDGRVVRRTLQLGEDAVPGGPIVEPGFRCRGHAARAALAKAKEAKP